MSRSIPERDWKYLRKIQPEMLESLCVRINRQAEELLQTETESQLARYKSLCRHVEDSDQVVADCFDDWSRSNIWVHIVALRRERLLTDEHLSHMSDQTKELLDKFAQLQ